LAEEIRIGVFVCDCGSNIAGYLDVKSLAEYAKTLPNVVFVKENLYTCSEGGINEIKAAIKEQNLNRVVVASCTPRTHEPLFRGTCAEGGLNPYLFEMVNIRDQCSWVHMQERESGTAKARDLIRMGVAKAALLKPQESIQSPVDPRAMVIGGGIAGMTAALAIANRGYEVTLIEKSSELGGLLLKLDKLAPSGADAAEIAQKQADAVRKHPNIRLLTSTVIDEVKGYIGNFKVTTSTNGGAPVTTQTTRTVNQLGLAFSAEFAKRYGPATFRIGVIEGSGGVGSDLHLLNDHLQVSVNLYQFARPASNPPFPRAKLWVNYSFLDHFYVTTGADDFLNAWNAKRYPGGANFNIGRDVFFGAGLFFTDDDLKTLLGAGIGSAATAAATTSK
jgi:hypothetical protein